MIFYYILYMENNYVDILAQLEPGQRHRNDHIMIVDGLNTLIRAFSTVNTINPAGHHVGGITGFLKSVGFIMRKFDPTRIIIAWDGRGGSQNRKIMNPNYKAQREHAAVIHWDMFDSKAEENQAIWDQADRLVDYLECLPVTYVRVDKLEADDIIAYLARNASMAGHQVTIVSSDKDFLQLVDDNVRVFSPSKKVLYDYKAAAEFLEVLPENYNIIKALIGDKSDNLRGVKGIGTKTLCKLFPELQTNPDYSLQDIYDTSAANLGKRKAYANIVNDWAVVETNFKMMDLNVTVLDENERKIVKDLVKAPVPKLKTGPFLMYLKQDKIEGITNSTEDWLSTFSYLQNL